MFENVNEIAVLVGAILSMAVGSIWYSPLLFGNHWMAATGLTEADLVNSKAKMPKQLVAAFIGNLVLLYVLAQFVSFAQVADASLGMVALLLSIFLASVMASAVIWEERSLSYLLINVGYAVVVIFGGMSIIWFWPW